MIMQSSLPNGASGTDVSLVAENKVSFYVMKNNAICITNYSPFHEY
jgi:hypothetical protein